MTDAGNDEHERLILVEISDRRLPPRMVAGRIRTGLRQPGGIVGTRRLHRTRLTVVLAATLLLPALGMARSRQAG